MVGCVMLYGSASLYPSLPAAAAGQTNIIHFVTEPDGLVHLSSQPWALWPSIPLHC